jgi:hypothetical protein
LLRRSIERLQLEATRLDEVQRHSDTKKRSAEKGRC